MSFRENVLKDQRVNVNGVKSGYRSNDMGSKYIFEHTMEINNYCYISMFDIYYVDDKKF